MDESSVYKGSIRETKTVGQFFAVPAGYALAKILVDHYHILYTLSTTSQVVHLHFFAITQYMGMN